MFCTDCGATVQDAHQFCWNCGAKAESDARVPARFATRVLKTPNPPTAKAAPRHFGQWFGLDPRIAFLTLIVDMMLNAGDVITAGLLLPVSISAGVVLGYIAYRAQINWYGDDKESAAIKGLILGLLTAIPTPLPELLYIPAGIVGLFHGFRRKISQPRS